MGRGGFETRPYGGGFATGGFKTRPNKEPGE